MHFESHSFGPFQLPNYLTLYSPLRVPYDWQFPAFKDTVINHVQHLRDTRYAETDASAKSIAVMSDRELPERLQYPSPSAQAALRADKLIMQHEHHMAHGEAKKSSTVTHKPEKTCRFLVSIVFLPILRLHNIVLAGGLNVSRIKVVFKVQVNWNWNIFCDAQIDQLIFPQISL